MKDFNKDKKKKLARSAVNRKVGGSSPPRDVAHMFAGNIN